MKDISAAFSITRQAGLNLKRPGIIRQRMNLATWFYSRLNHFMLYKKGRLQSVTALGIHHLPPAQQAAPILAFSHKRGEDVPVIIDFLTGRPPARLHGATMIATAGVFNNTWLYGEVFPASWKQGWRDRVSAQAARILGRWLKHIFQSAHCYPIYRAVDMPRQINRYESIRFGGRRVTGLDHETYLQMAARESRQSLMNVFQEMTTHNRNFVILPEGGYKYDGTIRPLQEFVAMASFRKKRPVQPIAFGYDELCPDARGRIRVTLNIAAPMDSPAAKSDFSTFLTSLQSQLVYATPITASHLIGWCLSTWLPQTRLPEHIQSATSQIWQGASLPVRPLDFTDPDLKQATRFRRSTFDKFVYSLWQRLTKLVSMNVITDPAIQSVDGLKSRLDAFWKHKALQYLDPIDTDIWQLNPQRALDFAASERTVNDLEWNRNHLLHLSQRLN
ncbi:MAG: hypothetical protein KDK39_17665 [Leptospiraceae bacterium]|nr:hypothetical protein [Leptospiraceae bacterium]